MAALTVADIDARIAEAHKAAKNVLLPVEERQLARKMRDAYLDERNEVSRG